MMTCDDDAFREEKRRARARPHNAPRVRSPVALSHRSPFRKQNISTPSRARSRRMPHCRRAQSSSASPLLKTPNRKRPCQSQSRAICTATCAQTPTPWMRTREKKLLDTVPTPGCASWSSQVTSGRHWSLLPKRCPRCGVQWTRCATCPRGITSFGRQTPRSGHRRRRRERTTALGTRAIRSVSS